MTAPFNDRPLPEMVVSRLLRDQARANADGAFVRFGPETVTYGEVHEQARRYAAMLADAGVTRGDRVAVMMNNSLDYVGLYFGLAYLGAAVVLVNTAFRGYMLEYVLNDAGCELLVIDDELLAQFVDAQPRLKHVTRVFVRGASSSDHGAMTVPVIDVETALAAAGQLEPDESVKHTDLHCVVYSSGTTGPSKGIMISNGHAVAKAYEVLRICDFTASDVLYSPLPLFYSMGLLRGVLSVALVGATIVLRDRFSVTSYWDDVRTHQATVGHTVFSIVEMLQSRPPDDRDRDHSLRCMFNARYDPDFEARFGVRLIEGYGLTEAGNAIYSRLSEPAVAGSCGRVSPEWEVRIADPDGLELGVGEIGEILIRPKYPQRIMIGYLNKADAALTATRDLWLHTGDLARRDADGRYFYQGRLKDMIRRRGQNISAWEVEQIIQEHPAVADAAAFAHPSDVGEDDLRVAVLAVDGGTVDLAALLDFCVQRMPAFMVPRYLEVRTELPRTPSGRVEKYRLVGEPLSAVAIDRGAHAGAAGR